MTSERPGMVFLQFPSAPRISDIAKEIVFAATLEARSLTCEMSACEQRRGRKTGKQIESEEEARYRVCWDHQRGREGEGWGKGE